MILNWDRRCGGNNQLDLTTAEFVKFVVSFLNIRLIWEVNLILNIRYILSNCSQLCSQNISINAHQ